MVKMPEDYPEGIAGLEKLADGHIVYDYYLYNGFYHKDNRPYKNYYKIGVIKRIGSKVAFDFDDKFIDKLDQYQQIEECIKDIGLLQTNYTEKDLLDYATKIKTCHSKKANEENTWKCFMCNKSYPLSHSKCVECDITKEVASEYEVFSRISTTSVKSDTSSVSKRRVIKKVISKD
jgi:hypothetical protein